MSFTRTIGIATTAAMIALTIASSGLAAGEPKSQLPFTRSMAQSTAAHATATTEHSTGLVQGEPKNQQPFSKPATSQTHTIVVSANAAFDWGAAAIGAAATIGFVLAAAGIAVLLRTPRLRKATASL